MTHAALGMCLLLLAMVGLLVVLGLFLVIDRRSQCNGELISIPPHQAYWVMR